MPLTFPKELFFLAVWFLLMSWLFQIVLFFLTAGVGNVVYFLFFREEPTSGRESATLASYPQALSSTNFQSSAMENYNRILNRHLAGAGKTGNSSVKGAVPQTEAERKSYEEEQRKLTVGNSGGIGGEVLRDARRPLLENLNLVRNQKIESFTYRCKDCSRSHSYPSSREIVICPCGKPMKLQK